MNQNPSTKSNFWHRRSRASNNIISTYNSTILEKTNFRDAVAVLFLSLICFLAIFQKLEILAIISIVFIGAIIFKKRMLTFLDTGLELLKKTKVAKVGEVEVTVDQKVVDISNLLLKQNELVRLTLSDLSSEQISLLLAIYQAGHYGIHSNIDRLNLRILRNRGLLHHNAPTLEGSSEVWLSELGKDIASKLNSKSQE